MSFCQRQSLQQQESGPKRVVRTYTTPKKESKRVAELVLLITINTNKWLWHPILNGLPTPRKVTTAKQKFGFQQSIAFPMQHEERANQLNHNFTWPPVTAKCPIMSRPKSSQSGHYKTSRPPIRDFLYGH